MLQGITTGNVQNLGYSFDPATSNLLSRRDNLRGLTEVFGYDNLDRLTSVSGPAPVTMTYASNGNIQSKTPVGSYTYGTKPHAVTSVTNPDDLIPSTEQRISYTSFNKADSIIEGNYVYTLSYGAGDQRTISRFYDNGVLQKTVCYVGAYEKEVTGTQVRQLHYIAGGDGLAAIFVRNNGNDTMYYVHTDHLGSFDVITNQSGQVVQRYSFDAWGRRRNPDDWTYTSVPTSYLFSRGYTGQEHLDQFALINMNGRMYDPVLGRFFSPDNFVQAPDFTQGFNRYAYCLNNPLVYTDPSGEFWHLIIGAAIGGIVNWATHGAEFSWEGLGYFGIGAAAGALGAGVGAGISSAMAGGSFGAGFIGSSAAMTATTSFATGAAIGGGAGFSAGFTTGFGNGLMGGQNFGQALWSGTKDGLIGGASGALLGGLAGGIDAAADGRNFWHGGTRTVNVSLPIPQVNQAGQYDCNYACAESVDSYYGNGRNQSYFQTLEPGNGQGLTDVEIGRMYGKAGYGARPISINTSNPVSTAGDIANTMSANKAVVLNYNTGISGGVNSAGQRIVFGHATVVTRVRIFDNGRFIINVMNPGGSTTRFTNANLFHLIFGVY